MLKANENFLFYRFYMFYKIYFIHKILEAKLLRNRWNAITSQEVELHYLRTALKKFKIGFSCSKTLMS